MNINSKLCIVIFTFLLMSLICLIKSEDCDGKTHPKTMIMNAHLASTPAEAFKVWHYLHKRTYSIMSEEGLKKYHNFKQNYDIVKCHYESGQKSYDLSLNNFADMSLEEFKENYLKGNAKMYKTFKEEKYKSKDAGKSPVDFWDLPEDQDEEYFQLFLDEQNPIKKMRLKSIPASDNQNIAYESIDWVKKAKLEQVLSQGVCGSCWAFASAQAVQAAYSIKTGKKVNLSQQQLVDCDKTSDGCYGGMLHTAMDYIQSNGLESNEDYKYTGDENSSCKYKSEAIVTKISDYEKCFEDSHCANDQSLFNTLHKGPVASVVDASPQFMLYSGGVFDKPCEEMNHAILVVGYHKKENEKDQSYWVIKNSWGEEWGDHGYIKIKQSSDYNSCLLNTYYVRPIIN